jgi:Tat protein translocase TatB subunit
MFGMGMGELMVILVIALIFLGPKRLPDVATTLGKAIRSFRKATQDLTDQLQVDDEVKRPLQELKAALRDEPVPHTLATQSAPKSVALDAAASAAAAPTAATAPQPAAAEAGKPQKS